MLELLQLKAVNKIKWSFFSHSFYMMMMMMMTWLSPCSQVWKCLIQEQKLKQRGLSSAQCNDKLLIFALHSYFSVCHNNCVMNVTLPGNDLPHHFCWSRSRRDARKFIYSTCTCLVPNRKSMPVCFLDKKFGCFQAALLWGHFWIQGETSPHLIPAFTSISSSDFAHITSVLWGR